ncbi:MAG: hypothetical protein Fues2KO_52240 [Fuerstiella sp.]
MKPKRSKAIRRSLPFALAIALIGGLVWCGLPLVRILTSDLSTAEQLAALKQLFEQAGAFAPLVYLVFVTIEVVVAPIPGLMLYAPGGILFGPAMGGGLALLGNVLGAGIACSITRRIGGGWLVRFFDADRLEQTQRLIERHGTWIVVLLRLNPVTSSDLVSYAAGFSRISVFRVMLGTAIGMAPLCFVQAWLAESVITAAPWLLYPLVAACLVYAFVVCVVLKRLFAGTRPAA